MKFIKFSFFLIVLSIFSCKGDKEKLNIPLPASKSAFAIKISNLLTSNKLEGAILIYDVEKDLYYSNDIEIAKVKQLPASTFKIPNSIIGLESGLLKDANSIFKWDGKKRSFPMWEKDLSLKEAFQVSCVPCYQELALNIGVDTMTSYLKKLDYPGMVVNQSNLNMFWLDGESKISPMEQIDFIKRLYHSELSISSNTVSLLKSIMLLEENSDYSLSGKTGWGVIGEENIGWFVGYLKKESEIYFFATAIKPRPGFDMDSFIPIRKSITLKAFEELMII